MNTAFTPNGWDDYQYWIKNDKAIIKRINLLINECLRTPFEGIWETGGTQASACRLLVSTHH